MKLDDDLGHEGCSIAQCSRQHYCRELGMSQVRFKTWHKQSQEAYEEDHSSSNILRPLYSLDLIDWALSDNASWKSSIDRIIGWQTDSIQEQIFPSHWNDLDLIAKRPAHGWYLWSHRHTPPKNCSKTDCLRASVRVLDLVEKVWFLRIFADPRLD